MFRNLYFIFILFFIHWDLYSCYQNDDEIEENNDLLLFAHIIYRHGHRSPLTSYLNDPYDSKEFWPNGLHGQLTQEGLQEHLELGKYLRKRYYKLLDNGKYDTDKVYIRSSDYDRTILSANANLLGFFPTEEHEVWTNELRWRPIPIHTVPIKLDHIVASERPCARYDKAHEEMFNLPEFLTYQNKAERYIKLLIENTGAKTYNEQHHVWDTLNVQYLENFTLPSWTEDMMEPDSAMSIYKRHCFKMKTHTTEMKKLKSGFLLREMLERFTEKTKSKHNLDRRLHIYSGHELTITNLLNALNLYDSHIPPYASCILFELYKSYENHKENFYVRIFYKNTTEAVELDITDCGKKCSLVEFYRLFHDVIPTGEFETECKMPFGSTNGANFIRKIDSLSAIFCAIILTLSNMYMMGAFQLSF